MGCNQTQAGMSGMSYMSPGLLSHTAGVAWNDVGVISIDFLGWSNVSLERRYLDSILFSGEIDVCNSLDTWQYSEEQWVAVTHMASMDIKESDSKNG